MYTIKKYFFSVLLLLFVNDIAKAQGNDLGKWFAYFGNQKINNKWLLQSDFQYRANAVPGQKDQILARAGLGYNLSSNNHNLLLGVAYIQSNWEEGDVVKPATIEKRIYQQYLFKQKVYDVFATHRIRMEERFLPSEFGLRTRYFLALQKSLNNKSLNKKSIYASIFNELFIDISNQKFDRNRFYSGIGYGITDNIRLETGYLIQAQKNITRGQLQLSLYNNMPFNYKNKK